MLYAVRNIVPLLVIAHPVQPGDGGTSWRLEEYITPCQHILAEYIAEHIGGYITKHNEEYMGKYTQKYIKKYTTFCQQFLEEDIRLRLKSKVHRKTHCRVYPGIMIMTMVGPAVDLENTSPLVNTFSLPSFVTGTKCKYNCNCQAPSAIARHQVQVVPFLQLFLPVHNSTTTLWDAVTNCFFFKSPEWGVGPT